jgi:hypothetical protein
LANHSRELIAGVSSLEFDYFANVFRFRQPPYQTETCVCVPLEAVNNFPVEKQTTINYRIKNLLRPMQVTEIEDLVSVVRLLDSQIWKTTLRSGWSFLE